MKRWAGQLRMGLLGASLALSMAAVQVEKTPDRYEPVPPRFTENTKNVKVEDKLGTTVSMDLKFVDTTGTPVRLGDYFNRGRPVLLQMGYFRCPQICDVVSQSMMKTVQSMDLIAGKDYDVLYVSIDPKERWQLGQSKRRNFVSEYGRGTVDGWNFLVGSELHIAKLADEIGFKYQYVAEQDQFAHPAMLTILTPEGKVSRYLYGVDYSDKTLRMSIIEAGQGKVGDIVDQLVMLCYHFDGYSGQYTPRWMAIMRTGGVLTVVTLAFVLGRAFLREARAARLAQPKTT